MAAYLDWPDYLIFVLLLIIYGSIGVYYGFQQALIKFWKQLRHGAVEGTENNERSTDEMFLGGRKLSLLPIVGSAMASFMSAIALMGNNSEVYSFGIEFWLLVLGYCIAFPVAAEIYAPIFYKIGLTSAHEVIYVAVVLYAPSLALSRVTGWHISVAILSSGLLGTFYTALGGIRAVVWTDLIQTIVMFFGLVLLLAFGCQNVGGITRVWEIATNGQRLNVLDFNPDPFVRHSFWTLVFGGAGMTLSIFATNQAQVQRYLACKDLRTARRAIHLQLPMNAVFLSLQMVLGLVTYAVFVGCDPLLNGKISAYDQIFPHLVMTLFEHIPALRGLFLATVFAAALSTLSSGINGIACVLVEDVFMDIYLACSRGAQLRQKTLNFIARMMAILLGLLVIGLAFLLQIVPAGVLKIAFSIFGALGGPILTAFTLGMLFPFVNNWGGLFGFLASLVTGLTMIIGTMYYATFREHVLVPLTNASCPVVNASLTAVTLSPSLLVATATTLAPQPTYVWSFFNLSYLYLTPLCLIVGLVVATPISLLTGRNTATPVSQSLLAWQAVWLYSKLPTCGSPQSTPEAISSFHLKKMNAMVRKVDSASLDGDGDGDSVEDRGSNGDDVDSSKLEVL